MRKFLIATCFATILSSCTDMDDKTRVEKIPNTAEFQTLFNTELQNQTQTFNMNAEDGYVTFTSAHGVALSIDGNCLKLNGQPVSGAVDIEFVEIFDRGNMLVTNKLTMGLYNNEKHILNSGGEFYINAKQNGQQLTLDCSMHIAVPTSLTGGTDNTMMPFNGTLDAAGNITWEIATSTELWIATLNATSNVPAYNAVLNNFGWFNCDVFINTVGPHTTITALVPNGYGNGNCLVLIALKSKPNSLGAIFGKYPVGLECHIIFVSEKDGKFLYAVKENQVLSGAAATHEVTFSSAELQTATTAEMVSIINTLP